MIKQCRISVKDFTVYNISDQTDTVVYRGRRDHMVVVLYLQLHVQSVPITTKVVSSRRCVLDTTLCVKVCQ